MPDDAITNVEKTYKSPMRKLVTFFKKSRDSWKTKCHEAKYQVKLLKNKIRYLERRKTELNDEVKKLKKELDSVQKKTRE